MTSVRGEELLAKAFPEMTAKSNIVLVVARPDGGSPTKTRPLPSGWPTMFTPKEGEKSPVLSVLTPRERDHRPEAHQPQSPDGQAVLVVLQLSTELMAVDNMPFIKEIYARCEEIQKEPTFPPACNWA